MYKNNVEIVVARYNEDLYWLNEYPFNQFEYIVYNKGDNENFHKTNVKEIVELPNIGRCDHTYLYHIIKNYDNLSNVVVFFPGSVDMANKKPKAVRILEYIIKTNYENAFFLGTHHNSLREAYAGFKLDNYSCSYHQNYNKNPENRLQFCKIRPYGKWYNFFFKDIVAHWVTFGGIFSIDKRDILQHPIDRYQFIIQTVSIHSNPEAGHYIERSWCAIFYPLIHTVKIKE